MIQIRKFLPADLKRVIEIEKNSFPSSKSHSAKRLEKFYTDYPECFIVAENETGIVGYGICQPKKDSAELVSLAVHPDFRQKGIGTELVNFLLDHSKKNGAKEASLNVRTGNKTAVAFHKKIGFGIMKTIKKYYKNGDDAYFMTKEI